jgi:hypothetical protein
MKTDIRTKSFIYEAFSNQSIQKKTITNCACPCQCWGQTNSGGDYSGHYSCFSSNNSLIEIVELNYEEKE